MDVSISWVGVAAAVVVGMAIAMVWYSDWGAFGSRWRRLTGVSAEDTARGGKGPLVILAASVIATAVALALGTAMAGAALGGGSLGVALAVGLVAWLGFSFSTLAQHNGFELKPAGLTVLNSTYQLVLFLGMALPIGLLA